MFHFVYCYEVLYLLVLKARITRIYLTICAQMIGFRKDLNILYL